MLLLGLIIDFIRAVNSKLDDNQYVRYGYTGQL